MSTKVSTAVFCARTRVYISIASLAALLPCSPAFAAESPVQSPAELVAALHVSKPAERPALAAKLLEAGPAAVGPLLPEMQRRRPLVLDVVAKMGDAAVPELLKRLKDPAVGGYAREALFSAIADGSATRIPDLLACMKDDELVGACGTVLVRAAGPKAAAEVPSMAALLKKRGERALYAASALGRVGPKAAPAVADLIGVLRGSDGPTRLAAATALGAIGRGAQKSIPILKAAAQGDADPEVGRAAAKALKKIPALVTAQAATAIKKGTKAANVKH